MGFSNFTVQEDLPKILLRKGRITGNIFKIRILIIYILKCALRYKQVENPGLRYMVRINIEGIITKIASKTTFTKDKPGFWTILTKRIKYLII